MVKRPNGRVHPPAMVRHERDGREKQSTLVRTRHSRLLALEEGVLEGRQLVDGRVDGLGLPPPRPRHAGWANEGTHGKAAERVEVLRVPCTSLIDKLDVGQNIVLDSVVEAALVGGIARIQKPDLPPLLSLPGTPSADSGGALLQPQVLLSQLFHAVPQGLHDAGHAAIRGDQISFAARKAVEQCQKIGRRHATTTNGRGRRHGRTRGRRSGANAIIGRLRRLHRLTLPSSTGAPLRHSQRPTTRQHGDDDLFCWPNYGLFLLARA